MNDVLILLLVSILNVVLSKKLSLSPVLGYLCFGAFLGMYNYIQNQHYAHNLSEFGVVFLLFVIGLELTFERLMQMRFYVFGFGGLQIVLTTFAISYILSHFVALPIASSIVIGCALSLSSTAVVLQVLAESKRQSTQVGRLSLAALLMQDFAVVPLLVIMPMLKDQESDILRSLALAGGKGLFAIFAITIAGRLLLRPFFRLIGSVKSEEVYVSTTLLLVLGASYLTADFGLSTAMGAFIAGILIAETEYHTRVENSIMPFKSLLLGLFFVSVGMSIDTTYIVAKAYHLLIASSLLILVKGIIILLLCKVFGVRNGASLHTALLMCQGSEFAFILFSLAAKQGVIANDLAQFLLVVVSLSMAVTPLLAIFGRYLENRLDDMEDMEDEIEFKGVSDLDGHVIIAGFGRVGRVIAYMLYEMNYNYIAVDGNLMLVKKARAQGFPVYHGDVSKPDILKAVGAERASCIILTMNDKTALRQAVRLIANIYKRLPLLTRSEDFKHGKSLKKLGASYYVPSTIETGLQMGGALLKQLGISEFDILDLKDQFRRNDYSFTEEIELFRGLAPSKVTSEE